MMKRPVSTRVINILFAALICCVGFAIGQTDQGRITGTVVDATGGVVPGATVTVTNELTGEARTATTKDDGSFLVVALKPTKYTIAASAPNFEAITKKGIDLPVGQQIDVELKLQAQGVTAQVDIVSGDDVVVNTSSAALGANVNPREVEGLPINGRQLSQL